VTVRFQADADLSVAILLAGLQDLDVLAAIAVEALLLIWHATQAEEWTNRICYLPL